MSSFRVLYKFVAFVVGHIRGVKVDIELFDIFSNIEYGSCKSLSSNFIYGKPEEKLAQATV